VINDIGTRAALTPFKRERKEEHAVNSLLHRDKRKNLTFSVSCKLSGRNSTAIHSDVMNKEHTTSRTNMPCRSSLSTLDLAE
jgi:hypothetical protein